MTAARVLALLAPGYSEPEIQVEHRLTSEQIRAVLRDAAAFADHHLDATFAALVTDPERNAAEAALDRQSDAAIDAGGGFRGSIDELVAALDG